MTNNDIQLPGRLLVPERNCRHGLIKRGADAQAGSVCRCYPRRSDGAARSSPPVSPIQIRAGQEGSRESERSSERQGRSHSVNSETNEPDLAIKIIMVIISIIYHWYTSTSVGERICVVDNLTERPTEGPFFFLQRGRKHTNA